MLDLEKSNIAVAQAQIKLGDAQKKADRIRKDGKSRAEAIRAEGEKRTISVMASIKQGATADADAEASRIRDALRRDAATAAIAKALRDLPGRLDAQAQSKLLDASIANLRDA